MVPFSAVLSFAAIAGLLTIVPGLDTAFVVRTAVTQGRRSGFAAALGIGTGVLAWGICAAVGISALLAASQLAYDALRLAGAAYLLWLGAGMLWASWRRRGEEARAAATAGRVPGPAGALASWWKGTLTNLLNPKVGVFYLAMLPQFIPARAPHLLSGVLLAGVHDVEGMAWFALLISAVHWARHWLSGGRVHRVMDRVTGVVLIGFGLRLALSRR